MKLMDEVAGIVAARHCKTNIVTASVDAINFHEKIKKGQGGAGGVRSGVSAGRTPQGNAVPVSLVWRSAAHGPGPGKAQKSRTLQHPLR